MQILIHAITISRLLLALSVLFVHSDSYYLGISIWSAFTDFFDGHLARRLKITSVLGERLDQIADKVFHVAMLILLLTLQLSTTYFVVLFVLREVVIVISRYSGMAPSSSAALGKWKTVITYFYIIYLFGMWYLYQENSFVLLSRTMEVIILVMSYTSLILSVKKHYSKR